MIKKAFNQLNAFLMTLLNLFKRTAVLVLPPHKRIKIQQGEIFLLLLYKIKFMITFETSL